MSEKKNSGAGLRGQSAGETALCTVGQTGAGLTYRGYGIETLAENAQFEEVDLPVAVRQTADPETARRLYQAP